VTSIFPEFVSIDPDRPLFTKQCCTTKQRAHSAKDEIGFWDLKLGGSRPAPMLDMCSKRPRLGMLLSEIGLTSGVTQF
jgi:hypothetical protein